MAKLNKQEVNAIANKIVNKLQEKANADRLKYTCEYKPSPEYTRAEALINKSLELSQESARIARQKEDIYNELSDLLRPFGLRYFSVTREILDRIINKECSIKEPPSIESIKEDIIIAGISDSFDVEKFIKEKLSEYSSYNS